MRNEDSRGTAGLRGNGIDVRRKKRWVRGVEQELCRQKQQERKSWGSCSREVRWKGLRRERGVIRVFVLWFVLHHGDLTWLHNSGQSRPSLLVPLVLPSPPPLPQRAQRQQISSPLLIPGQGLIVRVWSVWHRVLSGVCVFVSVCACACVFVRTHRCEVYHVWGQECTLVEAHAAKS